MKWMRKKKSEPQAHQSLAPERGRTLIVSRAALRRTHEYFLPYWQARVETAGFWFGIDAGGVQVVTTVTAPKLYQTPGNYSVDMASLRHIAAAMRAQGLTNLAQVHTHPSDWVDHSPYDDERAYSTREGALSLVWAHYGLSLNYDLSGVGILERRGGEWVKLDERGTRERIRLVDDFADFRWRIEGGGIRDEE
jgi:hypothetical protein